MPQLSVNTFLPQSRSGHFQNVCFHWSKQNSTSHNKTNELKRILEISKQPHQSWCDPTGGSVSPKYFQPDDSSSSNRWSIFYQQAIHFREARASRSNPKGDLGSNNNFQPEDLIIRREVVWCCPNMITCRDGTVWFSPFAITNPKSQEEALSVGLAKKGLMTWYLDAWLQMLDDRCLLFNAWCMRHDAWCVGSWGAPQVDLTKPCVRFPITCIE